ncbi:MAG: GMP synthase (glutamine-hydrolyzing) [Candidatus Bathyarchaeia archaeon]
MSGPNFDVDAFIRTRLDEIRKTLGGDRAVIAVSGGVDSTACALLTREAIGNNLICVFIDTGFMRKGEPEMVKESLAKPPLRLPLKILRARRVFMDKVQGLVDAEDKRKTFRETFYRTLAEFARREGCKWLIQGTIAPDLIETKGGVKTQHNVLEQIGIDPQKIYGFKILEPISTLYKPQVRMLSRRLGFPEDTYKRQPFPGPGLLVRCIGEVRPRKLSILKEATHIVEGEFADSGAQQYFAAIIDNRTSKAPDDVVEALSNTLHLQDDHIAGIHILESSATGVRDGRRFYGRMVSIVPPSKMRRAEEVLERATAASARFIESNPEYTRLLVETGRVRGRKAYSVIIRAVKTEDFMTAQPLEVSWARLRRVSSKILRANPGLSSIHYDLTPKPPATIEFE